jgi:hypothetical protein
MTQIERLALTNKHNLPEAIVSAVTFPWYQKQGHISATSLLKSPRQRWLEERHAGEVQEDASQRIWALLGQAVHAVLQRSASSGNLVEERLRAVVLGWTLSGQADILDSEMVLSDYKVTSVWSFVLDEHIEWEAQLNIYAWLYRQAGFTVKKARIVGILRDWQSSKAREDNYPQIPVGIRWVDLWTPERQQRFIENRIRMHQEFEHAADDELPPCTDSERWAKPTQFAVMREGRKSAVRLYNSRAEALRYLPEGADHSIVERPGKAMRCERYCSVNIFCNQFKESTDAA